MLIRLDLKNRKKVTEKFIFFLIPNATNVIA